MYTTKISFSGSWAAVINSFLLTKSINWVIKKISAVVYDLYLSSWLVKLTSTLFKMRKDIPRVTSILISANKNVFSQKWDSPSLFYTKKKAITMLKISSLTPSIFWATTIVLRTRKSNFLVKLGCIGLTLLPELINTLTKFWPNCIKYWIHETRYNFGSETTGSASVLAMVINEEIAKTNTSFLAPCWGICWYNSCFCGRYNI